jgi:hypothetical protein
MIQQPGYSYALRYKLQEFVYVLVLQQPITRLGQSQSVTWFHQLGKQISLTAVKTSGISKLKHGEHKCNAYIIIPADILLHSNILLKYERMFAAIGLSLS